MERALPRLDHRPRLATEGLVVGIDIGGTNQSIAVAHLNGEVVAMQRRLLAPGDRAEDVVRGVLQLIDASLEGVRQPAPPAAAPAHPGAGKLLRIGVGFGGPVDVKRGTVLTSHHVAGWEGYALRETLERHLDAPAVIDNDANAAAFGEGLFGAGRGHRNILYVNVGTGIGAGAILNGNLYHGQHGMAGEIGHVTVLPDGPPCPCGKRGCLEALTSGSAIGRRAREAAAAEPGMAGRLSALAGGSAADIASPHVFAAALEGDPLALRLVEETAGYLGMALGNAANVLDPSIIIIGGGVGEAGEVLFAPLRAAVRRHLLPSMPVLDVVPAALGYDAGIAGALALALDGV